MSNIITTEKLSKLEAFGREKDGSYSDRSEIIITPNYYLKGKWNFNLLDEVDGDITYIKTLDDMEDLYDTYFSITYKELV